MLFFTFNIVVADNTWNFAGFTWSYSGNVLSLNLYLNGNVYNEPTKIINIGSNAGDCLDFSGATTTLGGDINGSDNLNGQMEQFIYSNKCLKDDMKDINNLGRGKYLSSKYLNNSYTYNNDQLSSISSNGVTYNFGYDRFGNNSSVSVGSQSLVTNEFDPITGNLKNSQYGNGLTFAQDYDYLDRVIDIKYDGKILFGYEYDDSGNLASVQDIENGISYHYIYDFANRLVSIDEIKINTNTSNEYYFEGNNKTNFTYDKNNNLSKLKDVIGYNSNSYKYNVEYDTTYAYDSDNRNTTVTTEAGGKLTISYDTATDLGRINSKTVNSTTPFTTTYTYASGFGAASGATSKVIASIKNGSNTLNYTYDANGNILTITDTTSNKVISYTYNELNEVTREDNPFLGTSGNTIVYNYDNGGNIRSKTIYPLTAGDISPVNAITTINYGYTNTNWKDELTSYNGKQITYDAIGNPTDYNGYKYTWERGRVLGSISAAGLTANYKYNEDNIRTSKTVNGVTTNYHLSGDMVTYEDDGFDSIHYSYDANGKLVSMNCNGIEYFYVRNAQDDIIGLIDKKGALVVSYVYDTWGKLISMKDASGTDMKDDTNNVGYKNPYRYRGYRYDTETGLYYLNSRYYNPEWGRFINADSLLGETGDLLSHNMFAYCKNNPVNMVDPDGYIARWVVGGAVGAIAGGIYSYAKTGRVDWRYVAGGALIGAGIRYLAQPRIVYAATKAAEIGTSFGKQGTLVKNPGIKVDWGQFSKHGLGRMLERNVTTDQVNEWVRTGKALQQGANKYLFITKDGAAVVADNKLVTVMSKYDYDEAMEAVVKTLFGN